MILSFSKMSSLERRQIERLLYQTDQFTAQIRSAFLAAIDRIQGRVDIKELAALLESGHPQQAVDYVNAALTGNGFQPLITATTSATIRAGITAAQAAPVPAQAKWTFSQVNPATVQRLQANEFRLIRELTQQSRDAVGSVIRQGMGEGRNPLDFAREIRQHVGLSQRQSQAVSNYRRALQARESSVLDRALRDRRFDRTVARAVDTDTPLSSDQIDTMVQRYLERSLKYRAETIARTEATRAHSEGNLASWTQAVNDGIVGEKQITRDWIYTKDGKTRDAHIAIPGMNPNGVGMSEPFQTPLGPLMYPGDFMGIAENVINCRCATFIRYSQQERRAA